ncbi:MAG: hypothetical protein RL497_359, partial [Pseudomonadota bacterium]
MKFKLAHKLFLAHALIISVLVLAFLIFSYFSNQSLLSNAMNGVDEKVIDTLTPLLSQHYQTQGSWHELVSHQEQWEALVNTTFFQVFLSLSPKPMPAPENPAPKNSAT